MRFRFRLFVEEDRDGRATATVLGLPGDRMSAFGADPAAWRGALARELAAWIPKLKAQEAAELRFEPNERLERVEVALTPLDGAGRELEPVRVPFATVFTTLPRAPHAATVPRIGIDMALTDSDPEAHRAAVATEVAAFLRRRPEMRRLDALYALEPAEGERLEVLEVAADPMTPLEAELIRRDDAQQASERQVKEDAAELASVATDLSAEGKAGRLATAFEHEEATGEVLRFLRSPDERALLLVGPSGAGKTAAIHEAVRRHASDAERERRPVWAVSGTRLIAGMSGFGSWQERLRAIVATVRRTGAVLAVGDPHELIESGPSSCSDLNMAQYLKRPVEQGEVRLVAECTEEAFTALERRDRGFAALFRVVRVREAERPRTLAILERVAAAIAAAGRARISPDALAAACDLLGRFAPYGALPGKAVRFLRRIERDLPLDPAARFGRTDIARAFSRLTGLPESILSDEIPLDSDAARAFLRARVVAQDPATALVADAVARVKAGVSDPRRPLGSFLFLGPTGVGKTETAKALAELIFGSRDRLVRIDMTEYQDPYAATRLAGGAAGEGAGELVRRVRADPLSIVLLDEVEKADPGVFDLLLQVLGDGRLTDARGRTTDFRSAIVILTSNLGAELPEGSLGFSEGGTGGGDGGRFIRAAEEFFRPELLNRLDAVVPFGTLGRAALEKIAAREIDRVLARDGLARRRVAATVDDAVRARVLETGYHPRYGARPLKRAVERLVAAPLAAYLASHTEAPPRLAVEMAPSGEPRVRGLEPAPESTPFSHIVAEAIVLRISALRRDASDVLRGDVTAEARDEAETVRARLRTDRAAAGSRMRRLTEAMEGMDRAFRAARDLEDLALAAFHEGDMAAVEGLVPDVERLEREHEEAAFRLRATRFEKPDAVVILIAPVEREASLVPEILAAYERYALGRKLRADTLVEVHVDAPVPLRFEGPGRPGAAPTGAVLLHVRGENAAPLFAAEDGRHRFVPAAPAGAERHALVRVFPIDRTPAAFDALLPDLHTVKLPGERAARGIPAAAPPVVRMYTERAPAPGIGDARTGRFAGADAPLETIAAELFGFAAAWLGGGGAKPAGEEGAP